MENNLDDILIDPQQEKRKNPKSKRWVLMGVAFALLISVVGVVAYLVFMGKEESKGLEAVHTELERFESLAQKQSAESQKDDEFDKLIAEIKAKHQDSTSPKDADKSQMPKSEEKPKEQVKDLVKVLQKSQGVQGQKSSKEMEAKNDKPPLKQVDPSMGAKNQAPKKQEANQGIIKPEVKRAPEKIAQVEKASKEKAPDLSASRVFNSLEIPQGFYLQVGVFEKKPNADFLAKLSAFGYQVEKMNSKGKIVNRYLIGPFHSRQEAESEIQEVTRRITRPVLVEIR